MKERAGLSKKLLSIALALCIIAGTAWLCASYRLNAEPVQAHEPVLTQMQ